MGERVTIEQALDHAIGLHNAGKLGEAADIYRQILAAVPDYPDALHLLGVVAHEQGDLDTARDMISRAIDRQSDSAAMHADLALVLQDQKKPAEAIRQFENALDHDPDYIPALCNLASLLQDQGRLDDATAHLHRALAIDPEFAEAHNNLGGVHRVAGQYEQAKGSFEAALALNPDYVEAHSNLGNILRDLGALDDALTQYRNALSRDPGFAPAYSNRGAVLYLQGHLEDAVADFEQALLLDPDLADAHGSLGIALTALGRIDDALLHHRRAVRLAPEDGTLWAAFGGCLKVVEFSSANEALYRDLLTLLQRPNIDPPAIAPALLSALRFHGDLEDVLRPDHDPTASDAGRLSRIPLLLQLMALSPLKDFQIEACFTALRKLCLFAVAQGTVLDTEKPFLVALSRHCFVNEYVYEQTEAELAAWAQLEETAKARLAKGQPVSDETVAMLGAYRPLYHLDWATGLLSSTSPALDGLIDQQLREPLDERALRTTIPRLTPVADTVSRSVQAQYEENPYPRWVRFGSRSRATGIGNILRGPPLGFVLPDYVSPENPDILIAGCGTGQQVMLTADRFANARILAVDLSLTSLAYAARMTGAMGLTGIDYAQADIMALDGLDRDFDLIESVGVLHHLADPLTGLRILRDRLRPGGVMKIGLYSEAARQDIVAARKLIASQGYDPTPQAMRQARLEIVRLAQNGDALMRRVSERDSFFSLSECRDLLFHVQEHRFTLPQIGEALESLELAFLGFEFADPEISRRFDASHPGGRDSLDAWHLFESENPQSFAGMYQFWVRKPV